MNDLGAAISGLFTIIKYLVVFVIALAMYAGYMFVTSGCPAV